MLQWEDCCEDSGDLFKANRTRSHISFLFLSHIQETTDLWENSINMTAQTWVLYLCLNLDSGKCALSSLLIVTRLLSSLLHLEWRFQTSTGIINQRPLFPLTWGILSWFCAATALPAKWRLQEDGIHYWGIQFKCHPFPLGTVFSSLMFARGMWEGGGALVFQCSLSTWEGLFTDISREKMQGDTVVSPATSPCTLTPGRFLPALLVSSWAQA